MAVHDCERQGCEKSFQIPNEGGWSYFIGSPEGTPPELRRKKLFCSADCQERFVREAEEAARKAATDAENELLGETASMAGC